MAPFISRIQHNRFSLCFPVRIELYLYALRTFAVLVVIVIPALADRYFRCLRSIAVSDRISCFCVSCVSHLILCAVKLDCSLAFTYFMYRIINHAAIFIFFRQIRPGIFPLIFSI